MTQFTVIPNLTIFEISTTETKNMTDKEYEEFVRRLEEVLYEAIDGTEENR